MSDNFEHIPAFQQLHQQVQNLEAQRCWYEVELGLMHQQLLHAQQAADTEKKRLKDELLRQFREEIAQISLQFTEERKQLSNEVDKRLSQQAAKHEVECKQLRKQLAVETQGHQRELQTMNQRISELAEVIEKQAREKVCLQAEHKQLEDRAEMEKGELKLECARLRKALAEERAAHNRDLQQMEEKHEVEKKLLNEVKEAKIQPIAQAEKKEHEVDEKIKQNVLNLLLVLSIGCIIGIVVVIVVSGPNGVTEEFKPQEILEDIQIISPLPSPISSVHPSSILASNTSAETPEPRMDHHESGPTSLASSLNSSSLNSSNLNSSNLNSSSMTSSEEKNKEEEDATSQNESSSIGAHCPPSWASVCDHFYENRYYYAGGTVVVATGWYFAPLIKGAAMKAGAYLIALGGNGLDKLGALLITDLKPPSPPDMDTTNAETQSSEPAAGSAEFEKPRNNYLHEGILKDPPRFTEQSSKAA